MIIKIFIIETKNTRKLKKKQNILKNFIFRDFNCFCTIHKTAYYAGDLQTFLWKKIRIDKHFDFTNKIWVTTTENVHEIVKMKVKYCKRVLENIFTNILQTINSPRVIRIIG